MQVLGSLVQLTEDRRALPLPWWHRAPLGLLHGTPVYLALSATSKRDVGDLLVTVLDPLKWNEMVLVEGLEEDNPGVIADIFGAIPPLNIAMAETVTLETGDQHNVTLICEPFEGATSSSVK